MQRGPPGSRGHTKSRALPSNQASTPRGRVGDPLGASVRQPRMQPCLPESAPTDSAFTHCVKEPDRRFVLRSTGAEPNRVRDDKSPVSASRLPDRARCSRFEDLLDKGNTRILGKRLSRTREHPLMLERREASRAKPASSLAANKIAGGIWRYAPGGARHARGAGCPSWCLFGRVMPTTPFGAAMPTRLCADVLPGGQDGSGRYG